MRHCTADRCQQGLVPCPTRAQCGLPRLRDPMPQPTDFGIDGPHARKFPRLRMALWGIAAFTALGAFLFSVFFTIGTLLRINGIL